MAHVRSLVVFFTGGEPTTQAICSIRNILRADVNAQNVTIHALNPQDIAQLLVTSSLHNVSNDAEIVHVEQVEPTIVSPLDEAFMRICNYYGSSCKTKKDIPVVEMVKDYLSNEPLHEAFIVINNSSDESVSINRVYNNNKISREFIDALRKIVKTL